MRSAAAEAEGLLRKLRANDMRAEQRRLTLTRVREICDAWSRAHSGASVPTAMGKEEKEEEDELRSGGGVEQLQHMNRSDVGDEEETRRDENGGEQDGPDYDESSRAYGDL